MPSAYQDQRTMLNSHELLDILVRAEVARRKSRIINSFWEIYVDLTENINYEAIEEDFKKRVETISEGDIMTRIQQTRRQLERYSVPVILFERFNSLTTSSGAATVCGAGTCVL